MHISNKPTQTEIEERKNRMWNTWSRTSRIRGGDGVIGHVFEEGTEQARQGRAICGAPCNDGGGMTMGRDEYVPGCMRCLKLLRSWGLLPDMQ